MAIDFDGIGDFLRITTTPVISGMPFTAACWCLPDDVTNRCSMMSIYDISGGFNQHSLVLGGTIGGDPVQAESQNFLTVFSANTSAGYLAGRWQHVAGIWTNATDRAALLGGADKVTDTNNVPDPGASLDSLTIGATGLGTLPMFGLLAHLALWSVALTDAEVALLAGGANPQDVQRGSLIAHWPLANVDDLKSIVGGITLTVNGNPTTGASDPPVRSAGLQLMGQVIA